MKVPCTLGRIVTTETGDMEISFIVSSGDKPVTRKVIEKAKSFAKLNIDITEYRKARSLDANAYMWVLLEQLAEALKTTAIDLYKKYVHEVGVYKDFEMREEVSKTFIHLWQEKGIAWLIDKLDSVGGNVTLRAFYGSSVYNTKQMSRLIESVVEDCKHAGIPTLSDIELKSLIGKWK